MIAQDSELSTVVRHRLHAAAVYDGLPLEAATLCQGLLATVADGTFPGALVPSLVDAGEVHVYAAAPTSAEWRRLAPILLAFAGPTLTSFDGVPGQLPTGEPIADLVRETGPAITAVLRLPSETKSMLGGLRALERLRSTLARAPDLQRQAPEPTSHLLARFQDYLNVGARESATSVLRRLRTELRIDALNLKFLEIHLLATFDEWPAIINLAGFGDLCRARKPPGITTFLLEALYRCHLAAPFDSGDENATRLAYEERVRPHAQSMLSSTAASLTPGGWRVFALEAWISPSRRDLTDVVSSHLDLIGWLADKRSEARSGFEANDNGGEAPQRPIDAARGALTEFDAASSLDAVAEAIATLERLDQAELSRLRAAEPFRSLLQALQQQQPAGYVPRNWPEWLERAADPAFSNALEVARQGMDEWVAGQSLNDPVAVQGLVAALNKAQETEIAADRTTHAIPFIVGWLQRDPRFPRGEAVPVYSSLLTLLALGAVRGRGTYESSLILIYAMLASGLDEKSYRSLLSDVEEVAGEGYGIEMIYWLLEIIENLIRFGSPAAGAREAFLHSALAKVAPIYGRLSSLQRSAISRLSIDLGWEAADFGPSQGEPAGDNYSDRLAGKRIAIYSLNEAASRQAKAALEEIAPTAMIDCAADHVGSARLRSLSENVDIFVLAWQSAKHAATDFIREHRAERPLLYAQGRGFSSILRAIEAHLREGEIVGQ